MGTAYTHLIPFSELGFGEAAKIQNDIIAAVLREVVSKTNYPPERLVVRDIRAKDDVAVYSAGSDADVEDWGGVTGSSINAYETLATGTMDDLRWLVIFGVKITSNCACTAIKINYGGVDRAIWQLQALREQDDWVGLCRSGFTIPQKTPYTISRYVRVASSPAFIVLRGVVIEPRGKVVSP